MSLYFFFRPLPNGNCLYSSASICLFGHNNHLKEIHWFTYIESYENAKFYCQHSVLLEFLRFHRSVYSNFNSIFSCCLSQKSFNSFIFKYVVKYVKDETIYNLRNGQYCSFLYILALSTIIGTQINCILDESIDCCLIMLLNHVSVLLLQLIM